MQGVERTDRELLDAAALVGHLVPEGSMFAFLAAHRRDLFPDKDFADLFPSDRGRRSMPGPVAAAARCDLRWKGACGMALDHKGFHPSTLTYWRQRLARSSRPHRINDAVKQVIEATGILRGRTRRAVDSTILADAVATQDTITQLIAAIRRVGRQVPGAAQQIAAVCTGHDYTQPGKPSIDWDDTGAKDALVSALVNDATALLAALGEVKPDESAQQALALLALVAGQDVEPAEGSDGTDGRWRIARKVAEDRVISTVDPDARHTRKSPEARRDGYRAHVAADPETGIITDEKLTRAAGQENSDPAVAEEFLTAGAAGDPLAWYGDSAYGTGDLRDAMEKAGHQAVIKPKPLQAPVQGGFTIDDFTVDEKAGMVTCPAGHTVALSRTRVATFGVLCRGCPLRAQCTTCKTGRKLVLHERDDLLRAARRDWAATGLRKDYMAHRPNVERAVAQVATWRGRRLKLRYRGTAKNHAWLKRRTAVLNLRHLTGRGLACRDGAWVLAT